MQDNLKDAFNNSFQTCITDPLFLDRFYVSFISSSEEIKEKFKNSDMKKQKKMLLKSLAYMTHADRDTNTISTTAIRHDKKHLNIQPLFYTLWLRCHY